MRILFFSFSDFRGGANIAAYSIHKAVKKFIKNVSFLTVQSKYKNSKDITSFVKKFYINCLRTFEKILISIFLKKKFHQSLNIFKTNILTIYKFSKFDLLNIHWINRSMISLNELKKLDCKLVFSLHDMWLLNSTEHYSLNQNENDDYVSKYCLKKKKDLIYSDNSYFIAHNKWMLNKFKLTYPKKKNKIFLCKYYPINLKNFKPRNKTYLRKKYKIPINKKIVLFSAQDLSDLRKGYRYFIEIVKLLKNNKDVFFISLGDNIKNSNNYSNLKVFDFMPQEQIPELYSMSDIFICTSLVDNLPLTVLEAISSGNLVISFKNGGAEEVLKNIGYTFNIGDKKNIIKKIKNISYKQIVSKSKKSRSFAIKNFNEERIGIQYKKIFNKIQNQC